MGVTCGGSIPRGAQVRVGACPACQGVPHSCPASSVQVMLARWSPAPDGQTGQVPPSCPPPRARGAEPRWGGRGTGELLSAAADPGSSRCGTCPSPPSLLERGRQTGETGGGSRACVGGSAGPSAEGSLPGGSKAVLKECPEKRHLR